MKPIFQFNDFLDNLRQAGMTMAGENNEGVFSLCDYFQEEIRWHTEDPETDPWEWRVRALNEQKDIAYGKYFFKKSGYITREWYPYFYAVRRGNKVLEEEFEEGNISQAAKRIYLCVSEHKELPVHLIKQQCGFAKEEKSKFDSAVTELQMKFYIAMCGSTRKVSGNGEEYGWKSNVFCLAEDLFEHEYMDIAYSLKEEEAFEAIKSRLLSLQPQADGKRLNKFIRGI